MTKRVLIALDKLKQYKKRKSHLWNPCSVLHIHDQETLLEMYYVQDTFKLLLFSLK